MKKVARILSTFVLILVLLIAIFSNFNAATIVIVAFALILYFWEFMPKNKFFKLIKIFAMAGIVFFVAGIGFIFVSGYSNSDLKEEAVIVLGCAVHGYTPSKPLVKRLDACIEYSEKNPGAIIVVSGGQGLQESVSEARVMADYLISRGIDEDKILVENKATSTNENFIYSKELLDQYFKDKDYRICFITNHFHTYRAGKLAEINGIKAYSYSARTPFVALIVSYVREVMAVIKLWIFKS